MIIAGLVTGCGSSTTTTNLAGRTSPQCSLGTQLGEGRQQLAASPGDLLLRRCPQPRCGRLPRALPDVLLRELPAHRGRQLARGVSHSPRRRPVVSCPSKTWRAIVSTVAPRCGRDFCGRWLRTTRSRAPRFGANWPAPATGFIGVTDPSSGFHGFRRHLSWRRFLAGTTGLALGRLYAARPPQGGIRRSWDLRPAPPDTGLTAIILPISAVASMPWASADLGEPATFSVAGNDYLLFVGLAEPSLIRSIGHASESATGWNCLQRFSRHPQRSTLGSCQSIDPSPLIVGDRLYLYYGATKTNGFGANLGGSVGVRVFAVRCRPRPPHNRNWTAATEAAHPSRCGIG